MTPASTRRSSGTRLGHQRGADAPLAADAEAGQQAAQDQLPQLAGERAQRGAEAYRAMVANSARLRPMRSAIQPNSTPPAAQPTSSIEVSAPIQNTTAWCAAGEPGGRCSSTGRQLGATKLNSSASKTSKPQPAQPAAITSQW